MLAQRGILSCFGRTLVDAYYYHGIVFALYIHTFVLRFPRAYLYNMNYNESHEVYYPVPSRSCRIQSARALKTEVDEGSKMKKVTRSPPYCLLYISSRARQKQLDAANLSNLLCVLCQRKIDGLRKRQEAKITWFQGNTKRTFVSSLCLWLVFVSEEQRVCFSFSLPSLADSGD
jgi:hypothetical protein